MLNLIKISIQSSLLVVLFIACETKEYDIPENPKQINSSTADIENPDIFNGLTSVSPVDDYSATLNWTHSSNIGSYKIYDVTGGTQVLVATVDAPASSYKVTGLNSGASYTFKVIGQSLGGGKIYDEEKIGEPGYYTKEEIETGNLTDGRFIYNDSEITITTSTVPSGPSSVSRILPDNYQGIIAGTYETSTETTGAVSMPRFLIKGLRVGDEIKIFRENTCTNEVASSQVTSNEFTLDSHTKLPVGGPYYFYTKVINPNGAETSCNYTGTYYTYQTCPQGYVTVPADTDLGTSEFCVMAYEAKAWNLYDYDGSLDSTSETVSEGCNESPCTTKNWGTTYLKPGSGAFGKPWRMLDAKTAKSECRELGANYDLISNYEWMAIARNIEEQAANWQSGTVGVGCINRGNIGIVDACSYAADIEADDGAGVSATYEISNGSTDNKIYHFAGNVSEWVDMGQDDQLTTGPLSCETTWTNIEQADNFCSGQLEARDYKTDNSGNLTFTTYENVYEITPDSSGNLYIATDGGLAKSDSSASSFTNYTTLNGLAKNDITGGVAIDSDNRIFVGTTLGVNLSVDGGVTFSLALSANVNDIFIDTNDYIYVATTEGLSISVNNGQNFTTLNNAQGTALANDIVLSVYVDVVGLVSTVYIGTTTGLSSGTLSVVAGVPSIALNADMTTGLAVTTIPSNRIESLYASGTTLYVGTNIGFAYSTDSGANFTRVTAAGGLGSLYIWDIFVDTSTNYIYLATEVGMAYSKDSGASFTNRLTTHGLAANATKAVYLNSDKDVIVATDSGLSISTDDAASFTSKDSSSGLGGNASIGLGQISGGAGGAAQRGGSYKYGNYAGIYMLNLSPYSHQAFEDTGFRCVFRPN